MTSRNLEVSQCRTCINECIDYLNLYDMLEIGRENITLAEMLNYCTNLEICQDDEDMLPTHICKSCLTKLQVAYFFKKMVINSQEVLTQNIQIECDTEIVEQKQESLGEEFLIESILDSDRVYIQDSEKDGENETIEVVDINDVEECCELGKKTRDFENDGADDEEIQVEVENHLENNEDFDIIDKNQDESCDNESILIEQVEDEVVLEIDEIRDNSINDNDESTVNTEFDEENHLTDIDMEKDSVNRYYTCEVCGRSFHHLSRLQNHLETHTNSKQCVCEYCGKTLKNIKSFKNHISVHIGEKKYNCETCGRSFRSSSNLQVHMRIHTGERPFKCDRCDQAFVTHDMLKRHIYLHTGERPFGCDKCNKRYRDLTNLKAHQRTHDASKMFECEICGLKLTQMAGYRKHKRVHNGEMPYKCDICDRRFRYSSNLYAHVRLHSGEKPFKCTKCNKAFPTAKRLRLHSKVHDNKIARAPRKQKDRRGGVRTPDVPDQKVVKSNVVLLY